MDNLVLAALAAFMVGVIVAKLWRPELGDGIQIFAAIFIIAIYLAGFIH